MPQFLYLPLTLYFFGLYMNLQEKNAWNLFPAEFREGKKVGEVGVLHLMAPVLSQDRWIAG